ncbi:hypothetical protein ACIG3E_11285 [Streptomyces sp. NPDC053474]|uniref:hypothetical protein n=1 Tax=Streptomyces sp. NPDC053474 TaxID=3365704 RepID=UPI0037CD6B85
MKKRVPKAVKKVADDMDLDKKATGKKTVSHRKPNGDAPSVAKARKARTRTARGGR